jgi:hypothetical protein
MGEIAAIGSALIGGVSSFFGANKAEKAAKAAAKVSAQQYKQSRADLQPYMDVGPNALAQYGNAVGLNGREAQQGFYNDFQTDPGFETSLDNALATAMRKYSILGNTGGGLAGSLLKTGQNALYGQYKDRISQLGGLVDTGRGAAATVAGIGQGAAQQQGNALSQAGMLGGQGIIGLGQAGVNALNNYNGYQMWQQGQQQGLNPGNALNGGWSTATVNRAMF